MLEISFKMVLPILKLYCIIVIHKPKRPQWYHNEPYILKNKVKTCKWRLSLQCITILYIIWIWTACFLQEEVSSTGSWLHLQRSKPLLRQGHLAVAHPSPVSEKSPTCCRTFVFSFQILSTMYVVWKSSLTEGIHVYHHSKCLNLDLLPPKSHSRRSISWERSTT